MPLTQIRKMEKIASESSDLARRALRKSNELEALISLNEYRMGRMNSYKSVKELFKKLKRQ